MPRAASKAAKAAPTKRAAKKIAARDKPIENADEIPLPGQEWDTGMDVELVDVDRLAPHPDNPNSGDVDSIQESMDENGWYGVVTAQKSSGRILAGEHRWRAAKLKGAAKVPVFWKDVDDVAAIKIMLVDNASARRAVLNRDKVGQLLEVIGDIRGTGMDQKMLDMLAEVDHSKTKAKNATVGPGDVDKLYKPDDDIYEQQFGVVITCEDETVQEQVYNQALELGWKARAVSV